MNSLAQQRFWQRDKRFDPAKKGIRNRLAALSREPCK